MLVLKVKQSFWRCNRV